jgi:hypothetical protein
MNTPKSNGERKVSALRDLPRDIPPPAELWARIEGRLVAERQGAPAGRPRSTSSRLRGLAAAAIVAALAVGYLLGRVLSPAAPPSLTQVSASSFPAVPVTYVKDPRYLQEREALLSSLQARLATLPPESRNKVIASLETIQKSMQDLQAALGRDPSNALLQELLVNTYQDEMRLLATVNEAGEPGEGI